MLAVLCLNLIKELTAVSKIIYQMMVVFIDLNYDMGIIICRMSLSHGQVRNAIIFVLLRPADECPVLFGLLGLVIGIGCCLFLVICFILIM